LLSGADRVILPREFTLKQVREFREKTGLDIEVFIQGALCFSVSGQCLLSSFLGGRSANRGLCAQPCRKKYNGGFVLSTRDLCLAGKIPDLIAAGVSSLKIEGRLRDARYVSCATTLYRRVIDSFYSGKYGIDPDALMDMRLAFSREYTEGMLARVNDVVTPDAGGKRGALLGRLEKDGALRLNEQVRVGDGVGILTGKGVHGDVIRAIERCGRKVSFAGKGDTVRLFLNAKEGDEIVLTSGVARRKPYKIPKRKPLLTRKAKPHEISLDIKKKGLAGRMLLVKVYSRKDASKAREAGADRVYYNVFSKDYPMDDRSVNPYVPRCLSEWNAQKALKTLEHLDPNSVLSGDAGLACSLAGREVFLDMSGNVFNDVAVGFYNARGVIPVVSPELSFKELSEFRDKRFCVYAHGRIALMSTKYALPDESLLDEKGYVFPVRTELDMRQVLNSVPLGLFDGIRKLEGYGISRYLLDLSGDVSETVAAYRKIMQGSDDRKTKEGYTMGNYRAGVL
jgi:collagenase-like PrtC family protease